MIVAELCGPAYTADHIRVVEVDCHPVTGRMDLVDLDAKLSGTVAAVYFENPGYLGQLEPGAAEICALSRNAGAISVAGVDPITLGVVTPPGRYGADIAVGDLQPLGIHMAGGTGLSGFMAFRDEQRYLEECPFAVYTILATTVEGEQNIRRVAEWADFVRVRDKAPDWVGTQTGLWAVCAAVYLASH